MSKDRDDISWTIVLLLLVSGLMGAASLLGVWWLIKQIWSLFG